MTSPTAKTFDLINLHLPDVTGRGIHIEIKEEVRLFYNAVHGNQKDGVAMTQDAPAVIEGNSVTSNGGSGIITSTLSQVQNSNIS